MALTVPAKIAEAIKNASKKTGVSEDVLTAFAYVESAFKEGAVSNTEVKGLFQITGKTWKLARRLADNEKDRTLGYSIDINEQAYTAALLIRHLLKKYDNNRTLAAIAYNAGEGVSNILRRNGTINVESIKSAVDHFIGEPGFGPKKYLEVIEYPQKIARALNEPITITHTAIPTNTEIAKSVSTTESTSDRQITYNNDKSFLSNLFTNSYDKVSQIPGNSNESKINYTKTKLVAKIKSGLARSKSK